MDTKQKLQLKKFVRQLSIVRGRHTELVSVYVPAGYDIIKIIQHLQQEQGTAVNIKDAKTRNNVIDSLSRAIQHLKTFKKTPANGLAVFSGNVSTQENKTDIQVFSIEPPSPINIKVYRCDQTFKLDILEAMLEHKESYGLVVIDRKEATIGILKGPSIIVLHEMTSGVPGKFKAGGQSAARFHRLIEGMAIEFYKRVADICNKQFLGLKDLKGIIIGGPGPTKESFMEYMNNELKRKVVAVQDITYTSEKGLHDLVDKSKDILAKEQISEEKAAVEKFLTTLAKEPKRAVYGIDEVREAIKLGAVDMLLLSESLEEYELEGLQDEGEAVGADVRIISVDTMEGQQLRDLGKAAAILRYPMG